MAKVKFTGIGTFTGIFGGKEVPFGPGDILEVSEDESKDLLARIEGGKPVWQAVTDPSAKAASAAVVKPSADQASTPAAQS